MRVAEKIIAVTGGGDGIGAALCRRLAAEGAKAIAVIDINLDRAEEIAADIGGIALKADVSREEDMRPVLLQRRYFAPGPGARQLRLKLQ